MAAFYITAHKLTVGDEFIVDGYIWRVAKYTYDGGAEVKLDVEPLERDNTWGAAWPMEFPQAKMVIRTYRPPMPPQVSFDPPPAQL